MHRARPARRRLRWSAILGLAGFLGVCPPPLVAQSVLIQVKATESLSPLQGAFVTLLDGDGRRVGSALTTAQGRYLFELPAGGVFSVRAQMIGRATAETGRIVVTGTERVLEELTLNIRAVQLRGITAEGSARCTVRPEEGERTAVVWDEARKALEVAAWALEEELFRFKMDHRIREYGPDGRSVRGEEYRVRSGFFREPFVSRPAADLVARGFVQISGADTLAFAPNAAVLLSEPFLDTHCFRLRGGRKGGLLGLNFEPVARRRVPDIEGTLWLDSESSELRSVEFGYTGYHQDGWPEGAGGLVEFERLPSGAWIVRRWWIRMPLMAEVENRVAGLTAYEMHRVGIQEEGGEVLRILDRAGDVLLEAQRALLSGRVYDSIKGSPLSDARVYLEGTSWQTTTDAQGQFQIPGLPGGAYTVDVSHSRLDSLTLEVQAQQIDLREGHATWAALAVSRYSFTEFGNEQGVLGQIRGSDGEGRRGVFVEIRDESGGESVATFTEPDGGFLLLAPRPGRYRLRVDQVGLHPWESEFFPLDSGRLYRPYLEYSETPVDLSSPGPLPSREEACPVDPEPTTLAGRAWGEVRKALALETWGRDQDWLEHNLLLFDRERDGRDLQVWEDTLQRVGRFVEPVFPTRLPELLLQEGYVPQLGDTTYAFAPIPEVVLSPSFRSSHCLRAFQVPDSANLLGLAFQPLPGSDRGPRDEPRTDVRGIFVLDRSSGELKALHYRYTDFPGPGPSRVSEGQRTSETQGYTGELWGTEPGGWMNFQRLSDGSVTISEWGSRIPMVLSVMDTTRADPSPNIGLFGISERGGLALVTRQVGGDTLRVGSWERGEPLAFDAIWSFGSRILHGPGGAFVGLDRRAAAERETGRGEKEEEATAPARTRAEGVSELRGLGEPRIGGIVVDWEGQEPLSGATVTLSSVADAHDPESPEMPEATVLTNQEGRFLFLGVHAGSYELRVELLGRGSVVDTVALDRGQALELRIRLPPDPIPVEGITVEAESRARDLPERRSHPRPIRPERCMRGHRVLDQDRRATLARHLSSL